MRRTRVIRIVPVLDFGGVESVVALHARLVDRERFDFRVCTFHRPGAVAREIGAMGIPVDVLGVSPAIRRPMTTWRLYRYLRRQRPDVVHTSIAEANVHGALASSWASVPVRILEEVGQANRGFAASMALRVAYSHATTIIGVSQAVCRELVELQGAPAARVTCVYNPLPVRFIEPVVHVPRTRGQPFRVLAVGRLAPEKNHRFLLHVIRRMLDDDVNVQLTVAGDGPLRPDLQAERSRLGLDNAVFLPGFCDDVRQQLAVADLFVMPSIAEGLGVALTEAIAAGVPVLAAATGGIAETLPTSQQHRLLPLTERAWVNAIRSALEDEPAARADIDECRKFAIRRFSPHQYAKRLGDLYSPGELAR